MCKDVIITGVPVTEQIKKARKILRSQVIPKENLFQQRKQSNSLSPELITAMKSNA